MTDVEGVEIKKGDLIRHSFGIPPTTVDLFVFEGDDCQLQVIDANCNITHLDSHIAQSSYVLRSVRK